ncbi:MAG: polyprenyl synthetase family protein [Desulfamplus sp.]|nr:polyprenyl synthetase family protein [Desulfamplus sp.]
MDQAIKKVDRKIEEVLGGSLSSSLMELYNGSGLKDGKRLRAKLFLAFAGTESDKTIDTACSIELLHSATLIHDDVLDNSSTRRGRSALYRNHGIPESILYGDYVFTEAFKLISTLKDPVIMCEITSALSEVLKGELTEQKRKGDISLSRKEYLNIIKMKSGCLLGVSAKLGALMMEDKKLNSEKAYRFGIKFGIAYQMIDDYIDYFGTGKGKEIYGDIKEGVVTLPLISLIEKCSYKERRVILSHLKKKTEAIQKILELMDVYGIAAGVLGEVDKHLEETKELFDGEVYKETNCYFDILLWIKEKIDNARKEYHNSRRRVCRSCNQF